MIRDILEVVLGTFTLRGAIEEMERRDRLRSAIEQATITSHIEAVARLWIGEAAQSDIRERIVKASISPLERATRYIIAEAYVSPLERARRYADRRFQETYRF